LNCVRALLGNVQATNSSKARTKAVIGAVMFRQLSVVLISSFVALSLLAGPAMSMPEKQESASQDADSKSYLPPAMRQPGKGDSMSENDKNRVKAASGHAKKKFKTRYASSRTRRYYARGNDVFSGGRGFLGIFGF
jgi:hypothetical protein